MIAHPLSAAIADSAARSSRCRNDPVGLFGDTIRIARTRSVAARRDRVDVDPPRAVILERVRNRRHRFERGQVLEQRIARVRHQHRVAGIAQQLEQQCVGFAGARRQRHAIGGDHDAAPAEVGSHGRSRGPQAKRLADRIRARADRPSGCSSSFGIVESGAGRVGGRSDRRSAPPLTALRVDGAGHGVWLEAVREARRNHSNLAM